MVDFVGAHRAWAPALVFLLALAETIAFVSILIPSTALLVGVGGLVAAGGLDFPPLWVGASLGALIGSTLLVLARQPLWAAHAACLAARTATPSWCERGTTPSRAGARLAVLIGHFFGPLRAIVFLSAGVSAMRLAGVPGRERAGRAGLGLPGPEVGRDRRRRDRRAVAGGVRRLSRRRDRRARRRRGAPRGGDAMADLRPTSWASARPIRSGSPRRRRPTRSTTSGARSRRAGAGWCGRRSGSTRTSSTSTGRATARSGARTGGCSGLNNIELITDRPLQVNLDEIKAVKRDWPDRAMVVSLMVPCDEESWRSILPLVEETGADGVELNFGCPHGMSERGMGSAVGQVPEYIEMVARWCKAATRMPVIVKLTPEHHRHPQAGAGGEGGRRGRGQPDQHDQLDHRGQPRHLRAGADDRRQGRARRLLRAGGEADRAQHGGRDRARPGDGGAADQRHRRDHHLARRGRVHGARLGHGAGLHRGDDLRVPDRAGDDRRARAWMDAKGHARARGRRRAGRCRTCTDWQYLNLNYVAKARIDQDLCIHCGRCFAACEDTAHQAIAMLPGRVFEVKDDECVACNLCVNVCPVEDCITMERAARPGRWTRAPARW